MILSQVAEQFDHDLSCRGWRLAAGSFRDRLTELDGCVLRSRLISINAHQDFAYMPFVENRWHRKLRNVRHVLIENWLFKRRRIAAYLSTSSDPVIQLGTGANPLEGWLNTDFRPQSAKAIFMDATKRWPFADATFSHVFSEHMIEHVTQRGADMVLSEAYRTLKPGGVIRVVTPDLKFLIDLHVDRGRWTPMQERYVELAHEDVKNVREKNSAQVINNFVRNWGHQFIYDDESLASALKRAGFVQVELGSVSESRHEKLRGVENARRMEPGMLAFESIVMEGTKPKG